MKAVLLAGGLGTRMREETEYRPKPMVEIGGQPILWHIMKNLAQGGVRDFIIASGYKSEVINDYFDGHRDWQWLEFPRADAVTFVGSGDQEGWRVTIAFTGDTTGTGGRVSRVGDLVSDERFLATYGDGLADVQVSELLDFHEASGSQATVTAVQPTSRFGLMDIDTSGRVLHFREKPKMKDWVSIGYFVFEPRVLRYLSDDCGLEEDGLTRLARDSELSAFRHEGFWQPMDTYREYQILEGLWESGEAPWRTW
ncbi:MAG: NTP transferase domain-containing protein [Actinomycetia bacterium]|nr:NTP transferase domain-containing protein [Actinomycetes bacterium]